MGRKKKSETGTQADKMYFTEETEDAIVEYNTSDDPAVREHIFRSKIIRPFDKLSENIINRFKFQYINLSFEVLKRDVIAHLITNIQKYKQKQGKAFSYFSVCAKNYLILQNNNAYKELKRSVSLDDDVDEIVSLEETVNIEAPNERDQDDIKEFIALMIEYWENNINRHFKKKRDIAIANAVVELFRRADGIENFNKKALYLLIREMTDYKTNYITKVVNKMRNKMMEHLKQFNSTGYITD